MTDTRYQLHPELRLTALAEEGILLHLGERKYFSVNETGLAMLEALRSPKTVADLTRGLLDGFDTTEEIAGAAARAFIDRCLEAAVVVEAPPG